MHDKTHIDWQAEAYGYRTAYLELQRAVKEVLFLIRLDHGNAYEGPHVSDAIREACLDLEILLAHASIPEDIEELKGGT